MRRLAIAFLVVSVFALLGCVKTDWTPTKKELTSAKLETWAQYFRLYHEMGRERAPSMETVLTEVRAAVQKSLSPAERSALPEKEKIEFLADSWATPFQFTYVADGTAWIVTVAAAGPDRRFGTDDDMKASIPIEARRKITP